MVTLINKNEIFQISSNNISITPLIIRLYNEFSFIWKLKLSEKAFVLLKSRGNA